MTRKIDALIITALPLEHDEAKKAASKNDNVSYGVERWESCDSDGPTPYIKGIYQLENGGSFLIALAYPTRMGATPATSICATLVERIKPKCIAMCGVCAGNPEELDLGDVVISEMAYFYDEGKRTTDGVSPDHRQNRISETWLRAALQFSPFELPSYGEPDDQQAKLWLLERIHAGDDPVSHKSRNRYFPESKWRELIALYLKEKIVTKKEMKLNLSKKGKAIIEDHLFNCSAESPKKLPFRVKVGPIASGSLVIKDGVTWETLKQYGVRTVAGLEMEAAAIGELAHRNNVPEWIVVKGVMDHANPNKNDRIKEFAARSSAEVLFRFLSDRYNVTNQSAHLEDPPKEHVLKQNPIIDVESVSEPALLKAIRNIAEFGDTDVCPFPPEKSMFYWMEKETYITLDNLYFNHYQELNPVNEVLLSQIGYTGFRWVSQIDPIWNAYYLGLCLLVADKLEKNRISISDECVFSYRYKYNEVTHHIFDTNIGWPEFNKRSNELGSKYKFVVKCDIADFYHRISHEGLLKALDACGIEQVYLDRIRHFLSAIESGTSVGLPVGGPASRLFAEIVLSRTDHVLRDKGIPFCRFADDYHLFADRLDEAYNRLITLSELLQQEGLTLQKLKTRVLTQKDFLNSTGVLEGGGVGTEEVDKFMRVNLRFDPYAQNAKENYDRLGAEVGAFDILGMLSREMAKSRVNEVVMRRLTKAVRFLDSASRDAAVRTLVSEEHWNVMAPVFAPLLMLIRDVFDSLSDEVKEHVYNQLSSLYRGAVPIMRLDLNLAYWLQILARSPKVFEDLARKQCVKIYEDRGSKLVRRNAILAIADLRGLSWLSTEIARSGERGAWERRAFLAVSHLLGAREKKWRETQSSRFDAIDKLYEDWGARIVSSGSRFSS